jgi:predicted NAD-dependent protein-ADP-ribosyltransferase YbiA (DUF1768 family)
MELFDEVLIFEGIAYASVENFYQAMKTDDLELREKISFLSPRQSKTEMHKHPVRGGWTMDEKMRVMEFALNHKFTLTTSWGKKLLETGDEDIIEWNNWGDTFFGVDVDTEIGRNELGKLLMKIRRQLLCEKLLEESL